jgi:hypothetical protein
MNINDTEYSDKMLNNLQQALIALNNLVIEKQGEILGYSDFEKFYISLSFEEKNQMGELRVNCKDLEIRKQVWKILAKKINAINEKIINIKDGEEYPSWLNFDKMNFNFLLLQLDVNANEKEEL